MQTSHKALANLNKRMTDRSQHPPISFDQFLQELSERPTVVLRNVFQILNDLVQQYMGAGIDEYPNDPESIHYVKYDCSKLFEEGTERPFFADRLFANRFVNAIEAMRRGAQQNKIYIFNGPPGCGKSTFLNNLMRRIELYANSREGSRYEIVWRLDPGLFDVTLEPDSLPLLEKLSLMFDSHKVKGEIPSGDKLLATTPDGYVEIACPCHDHPILIIPRDYRRKFFDDLFGMTKFKRKLFDDKEYQWVFREKVCTFCSSLYQTLLNTLKDAEKVHEFVYARPFHFNRRLSEGISVYNPGDRSPENNIVRDQSVQWRLNAMFKNQNEVKYLYSHYAKTNNGIYALMDIKSHNVGRLIELHNIISEGVHKVDTVEENVNSLLLAVMNPEDKENIKDFKSFSDRIEYINIPYVLDLTTEVKIYSSIFGSRIEEHFLPRVLENFARVILSTRLNRKSEASLEWIGDPQKYGLYCDENLLLLKMEIYSGLIPDWLSEEDKKALTARVRRKIISESDREGTHGISGRDSIKVFNEFITTYMKQEKLVNMSMLCDFFNKTKKDLAKYIPTGFIDSLLRMYDYTVLQEVKESLYYYNERQITRDILNYLFAINFEPPSVEVCTFTKEKLEITEEFFSILEHRLLGSKVDERQRRKFREDTQHEYTSNTLTQEIMVGQKSISQTALFKVLRSKYVQHIKEKSLDPFLENENFRRAIKDYNTKDFKTYDKRIRDDVRYLIRNLRKKFNYTEQGAKEVCIYVIDNDLTNRFDIA
ncbi:MAG: serine protein kinase PrkA [Chitinivibrionales bacterium]|nr:serine protein kinase PrkA [Chitinivibrionales bacterium]